MLMILRSTTTFLFVFILLFQTLNAFNPAYNRQYSDDQPQPETLINLISKQLNKQQIDLNSSEMAEDDDDDGDQLVKRNKYPNFHLSPLWLSRRTRTNRIYGKPLWISRTG